MKAMNTPISDDDLVLYRYRDSLDQAYLDEIAQRLREEPALAARYDRLCALLEQVDGTPVPMPDADFEARLWRQLLARIDADETARHRPWLARLKALGAMLVPPRAAYATVAALLLAVFVGYQAGRQQSAPQVAAVPASATVPTPLARPEGFAPRVLDAYVSAHLRETEGVLLTAANSADAALLAGNRDLAMTLIESNRLYAQAAVRAGNTRLADFLRQLEPLLIDLANRPADAAIESQEGLRDYLGKTDLLFQVRATQARLETPGRQRT